MSYDRGVLKLSLFEHTPRMKPETREVAYQDENITVYSFPVTQRYTVRQDPRILLRNSQPEHSKRVSEAKTALGLTGDEIRAAAVYHMFKANSSNTPVRSASN